MRAVNADRFSAQEPAINRYASGGLFIPHRDRHALTVNILLRSGSFEGGGTAFWREGDATADQGQQGQQAGQGQQEGTEDESPTLVIQPAAGVGVVFVCPLAICRCLWLYGSYVTACL